MMRATGTGRLHLKKKAAIRFEDDAVGQILAAILLTRW